MENTLSELKAEVDIRGLGDSLEAYATEQGKNVSKFNKNDYLVVLGDKVDAPVEVKKTKEEIAEDKAVYVEKVVAASEKVKANTAIHNNTKVMCVVTDHYVGMTMDDEDVPGRVFSVSWGNKMGSVTGRIRLDGEPQYLHIGTIAAAKEITLPRMGKNSAGKEAVSINGGKRFTIVVVDGWSESKLEQMKKSQKIRNA